MPIKKKKKIPIRMVLQEHHICYNPPHTVWVRQTEHFILTMMQRMSVPSVGFISALSQYIIDNREIAVSPDIIRSGDPRNKRKRNTKEKTCQNK